MNVQDSPGLAATQARMTEHAMSIYATFNSLDLGFDHNAALAYAGPLIHPTAFGQMLAFAAICVEQDRAQRPAPEGAAHRDPADGEEITDV